MLGPVLNSNGNCFGGHSMCKGVVRKERNGMERRERKGNCRTKLKGKKAKGDPSTAKASYEGQARGLEADGRVGASRRS